MIIKILGEGCPKCNELYSNVSEVIAELNLDATIEKVEDFREIVTYGVMTTPALVIDDKVISSGRVLSVKEVKKFL